ncbi:hypothetical protein AB0L02_17660 [Streptomyces anulatus]|uniref:DUF7691 family protein n=1 Tax=Streptomyces anulatus TaxID=1892 RepID=UPI0034238594
MSHSIVYSTADQADVLAFLGSNGALTADQQRRLGNMRNLAQQHQDRSKPAADAYRAVLDRMDLDFRYDVQVLIDKLDFEHDEWETATKHLDWYTQDTLFFSLN